jgi:diguanylate cyclase (GGDEF)-like protein
MTQTEIRSESGPNATTDHALRVLVVDDEEDAREVVWSAILSLGHSCAVARDGVEALEMQARNPADVVISDWKMPRMDGLELCRRIRAEDPSRAYTHFIFATGNGDKAHIAEGIRAGADDYLVKPIDIDLLEIRLDVARRMLKVHGELRARNAVLRCNSERAIALARTDSLTTAFSRLALTEDLGALAGRVVRYGHRYCAALCDVDDFSAYNDCFGHLAGDDALRSIAHAIAGQLRRGDGFYRYDGEEFLAILPEQSIGEALAGAERVRLAVERLKIPHAPSTGKPFVTISVGMAALDAASPTSIDDWLRRSDTALSTAKALGRNRVEVEAR